MDDGVLGGGSQHEAETGPAPELAPPAPIASARLVPIGDVVDV